ncbi:MAG: bifunctional hydroxymethylpyrimidine kinase/phosphomethylpyrimidine kinase [Bryobacteraceae bacterium]
MRPVALTIAGSDPSGGAGVQADLKTFHQFGVYGEAVITLATVQNTRCVSRVHVLPSDLVTDQIEAVISDIRPQAAKTGALGNVDVIEAVARRAARFEFPLVVDPVLISKHGARLLSSDGEKALRTLLQYAALVTPNIPEAEALTGLAIHSEYEMIAAGRRILEFGCGAVLVKGGHSEGGDAVDILATGGSIERFSRPRIQTRNTHGTGCTFSAAITACLAKGASLTVAVATAKEYIQAAIESAVPLGSGIGPLNHFANVVD